MTEIRFDDQVALVTGAGGGMGRSYAIELARRGARVVVNDYGGTAGGVAGTSERAQAVVDEIEALGGVAIVNSGAVGTLDAAREMVGQAVDAFGRLDIVVNNAGIQALGSIDGVSFDRAEAVYRTNLMGPHALMSAAWPIMKSQSHGRILNVSSNAALGVGGSASYAASKAGMIGLTLDAAREGEALGIRVNAVMPVAYSRMFDDVPNPAFVEWVRANFPTDKVALAIIPLLSRDSEVTGRVFSTGGGRIARVAFVEGKGVYLDDITPETARAELAGIDSMDEPKTLNATPDDLQLYISQFPFEGADGPGLDASALSKG